MPNKSSLDPGQRILYGASLRPPPGHVFDAAVATTFSLDLETALAAPVSLALYAAETGDEALSNHLALLEGVERIADRLVIFADAERIQAHTGPHSRLCSLLERIVFEVTAPNNGAFHPKMWALRFRPTRGDGPKQMRLLVLSRNLTRDRSWDIALALDGVVANRPRAENRPLAKFVRQLPGLATGELATASLTLVDDIAEDIRRTEWNLPDGFHDVSFAVSGLGKKTWKPEPCKKLGVISPFCDDHTLSMLADLSSNEMPVLIGRSDELAVVSPATLERFARVAVLDETAATEDGEEIDETGLQGLHAKAFVAERGRDTEITIGSGNATRPALMTGGNVEFFATLTGRKSRIGGVDDIFGENGFGGLTRPYIPGEPAAADDARRQADARLDAARRTLCRAGLKLRCAPEELAGDGTVQWHSWLIPPCGIPLPEISHLRVWPITRGDGHARDALERLRGGEQVDLGGMPLLDLTRFLACQITDEETGLTLLFTAGLVLDGLPAERHAAILGWVIDSRDAFFRYLRLLLSELDDPFVAMPTGSGHGKWRIGSDDGPILESMVRAFCHDSDQLRSVERMIARLGAAGANAAGPIPEEFRELWAVFRNALENQDGTHAG